jgi:sugar lactone lactonase YvrE
MDSTSAPFGSVDPNGLAFSSDEWILYMANSRFGGPDRRMLFFTARTSVYSMRVKVPGQPHPSLAKTA